MSEDRPLYLAIKQLIDWLSLDRVDFLVFVMVLNPHDVQSWLDGTSSPPDTTMLNIVKLVHHLGWHELPKMHPYRQAVDNFWEVVERCDRDPTFTEFKPPKNQFDEEQSISDYFHQWTGMNFESNVGTRLGAVPALHRYECLEEIRKIIQKYTPKGETEPPAHEVSDAP